MFDDSLLSISAAAQALPDGLCLRTAEGDIAFAEMARRVCATRASITRPATGRPYILKGDPTVESLTVIYTLLEAKIPMLLLSPKLTERECEALCRDIEHIKEPVDDSVAAILYTSGTTGRPKPALITRKALLASATAVVKALEMNSQDLWQLAISPARIGGLGIVVRSLVARSAISLPNGKFDACRFIDSVDKEGVTLASIVPAMLADIFEKAPTWVAPVHLKALVVGGSKCPLRLRQEAADRGIPVVSTYAMTECASSVVITPLKERNVAQENAGVVLPGVTLKVLNGQLAVKGAMVTPGYWGGAKRNPTDWHLTGDLGEVDVGGRVTIMGRASDIIMTGGESVDPAEVQEALQTIDGIDDALVLGMPDEKWGAIVTALLVNNHVSRRPETETIAVAMHERLARYKCPRRIAWVETLPRNGDGKLIRKPEVLDGIALTTLHYRSLAQK